jgi:hypothetical protein
VRRIHANNGGFVLPFTEKDLKTFMRQALNGKVKESHITDIYDRIIRKIS